MDWQKILSRYGIFRPLLPAPRVLWDKLPWMHLYLGFSVLMYLFQTYLSHRQARRCSRTDRPEKLENIVSEEEFASSNAYEKDKLQFSIVQSTIKEAIEFGLTYYYVSPWMWNLASSLVSGSSEYLTSIVWVALTTLMQLIISLPFSIYGDFVLEARHGFNKKTVLIFIKDIATSLLLQAILMPIILFVVIWALKNGGDYLHWYLWASLNAMMVIMMFIYPNVIAPLYNKFEPVKDMALREKIESLAKELKFPVGKLYQIDGSKRSAHSNAYFYGIFGCKQIVLYDTLLNNSHEEILAVLSHEMGHWKKSHFLKSFLIQTSFLFFLFSLYSKFVGSSALYNSFGYFDTRADIIGLMLFMHICSPISFAYDIAMVLITRMHEYEADKFSFDCGNSKDLSKALTHLHTENKGHLDPDEWYSWFNYTHPTLLERLNYLEWLDTAKEKKKQ